MSAATPSAAQIALLCAPSETICEAYSPKTNATPAIAPVWMTVMRAQAKTKAAPSPSPRRRNAYSPPVSGWREASSA